MKTPREILLKQHQSVESKLDQMWVRALAPELRASTPLCEGLPTPHDARPKVSPSVTDMETCRSSGSARSGDRRRTTETSHVGESMVFIVGWTLWRELLWPSRRIWAGLACAWALILVLNVASYEPATRVASKSEPRSRDEIQALIEQRKMLAQLIGPVGEPATERKSNPPGPRSEQMAKTSVT